MRRSLTGLIAVVIALAATAVALGGGRAPLAIQAVAASPNSLSATITWQTTAPAASWVEYGVDQPDSVWTAVSTTPSVIHQATLVGLRPSTTYVFRIVAKNADGPVSAVGSVTTAGIDPRTIAGTAGRTILLNGQPFFPIIAWFQCPQTYDQSLAIGVDLFLGSCPWHSTQSLLDAIGGRAYAAVPIGASGDVTGTGLIGWNQLDEAEAFGILPSALPTPPPASQTGRITFFTLSAHFGPATAPPPVGKALYPDYVAKADVIGFDLYILTKYCGNRWSSLADIYDEERELATVVAPGKPTYEWIETGPAEGECLGWPSVTPETVRAEVWLAIAGGATGIGYFTHTWNDDRWSPFTVAEPIQAEIVHENREIAALAPALLGDPVAAAPARATSPLRVGARFYDGATYVIAVNPTYQQLTTTFVVPSLGSAPVVVYQAGRTLSPRHRGVLSDAFPPLGVHIYIAPPPGT